MSKQTAVVASVDTKVVKNFSFLTLLTLGLYLLFSTPAFADECPDGGPNVSCTITTNYDDGSSLIATYDASGDVTYTSTNATDGSAGSGGAAAISASGSLTGVGGIICDVVFILVYDIGRGIATLSVIAVGVAAMFGKASWPQAVTVAVGIGIIFGGMSLAPVLAANLSTILSTFSSVPCVPSVPTP